MRFSKVINRGRRLRGFIIGSVLQTLSTFESRYEFSFDRTRRNIVLVPGAFCTSSVMNKLGKILESKGFNIFLPSDMPYFYGPIANICPLKESAKLFLRDVYKIMNDFCIDSFYIVGHSNGGLIPLFALNLDLGGRYSRAFKGIITLATPFKGVDIAKIFKSVLPVAKDILPNEDLIINIKGAKEKILLCIQSGSDFLVPTESQHPDGISYYTFDDFNHMDFIVGCEKKIRMTADKITEILYAN